MGIQDGYKMTEIGQLPIDWEVKKIDDIANFVGSGVTPRGGSAVYKNSGIPFIRSQNVYPSGLRLNDVVYLDETQHQNMIRTEVHPDDVLLNITGASIGRCTFVPARFERGNVNQHVCIIRSSQSIYPQYLSNFLNSKTGQNQIDSFNTGSSREGLNFQQVRNITIPLPPLLEQKKIADILSTVDEHISETESLIEKTKILKQGMMQHLLTKGIGHTEFKDTEIGRIPVEWEVVRISNILKRVDARAVPLQTKDYSAEGKYPIVDQGQTYICGFTNNEDCLYRGELPVTIFGDHTRIVKYVDFAFAVGADGTQILIPQKDTFFNKYFYYAVLNIKIKNEGYQRHFKYLKESKIAIPIIQEQKEIASILTSIDNQIDSYQTKLTSLTKLKSALMQQLLTGKKRVKV